MEETYVIVHHEVQGHPEDVMLILDCCTGKEKPRDNLPIMNFPVPWKQAREIGEALCPFDPKAEQSAMENQ